MSLIPHLQTVAKGKGRGRDLTLDEAQDAMTTILSGNVAPETLGAFLMVLRYRGETPNEIAGFTAALRNKTANLHGTYDLDWPCYAAGRTRGSPHFLLSAKLVAQAGYRVVLHGWNSHQGEIASIRDALGPLDIPLNQPDAPLNYLSLETLCPEAFALLKLRDTLGLRSCINTVLRMWNPCNAPASVQGVFHPSYRGLQTLAAEALGQQNLTIIKGGGGEFERNPSKQADIFGLRDGQALRELASPLLNDPRKLNDDTQVDPAELWTGSTKDSFSENIVIGTAALALWTLKAAPDLDQSTTLARTLWANRHDKEKACA